MGSVSIDKPHAVLVPFPAQGHINPMLQLAKLLHSKGFHITFVNSEYNHRRFVRSRGLDSVKGIDDFQFETIPDGLPHSDVDITQDIPTLCDSTSRNCLVPFRDLLTKLNGSTAVPPVSCIVSDGVMSFTLDAADDLGIPNVLFWTMSACGFMAYLHYRYLVSRGIIPLKDVSDLTNGYLDSHIDNILGMTKMRLRDFPSFVRTTDPEEFMIRFMVRETGRVSRASAIILNTFDELERPVLDGLALITPPVYAIGPLFSLSRQLSSNSLLGSLSSSLWKEDANCIDWLEGRKPRSVLYVNFGSITVMTKDQILEFAWGLAKSRRDFLWVIRPDLVNGENAFLPEEFLIEIKGRGLLAKWCNQEAILSHPSVGGFLTHCGWNSTLESINAGIPMICWPFFAEQQTNCRYICVEWEIGMEIDNNVRREVVEGLIKELMEGEKGKEMRKKAFELKESAVKAIGQTGSSTVNLDRMIQQMLLKN